MSPTLRLSPVTLTPSHSHGRRLITMSTKTTKITGQDVFASVVSFVLIVMESVAHGEDLFVFVQGALAT